MNLEARLETVLQKIDELRLMVEKHFDNPQNIPSIESALVMEKLQFAYDVYFKMGNQAKPVLEIDPNANIDKGKREDVFVVPRPGNTIEEIEEAARESLITGPEEEDMVLAAEKQVEMIVETPPEDVEDDFAPMEAEVGNEGLPDPESFNISDGNEIELFPGQQTETDLNGSGNTGKEEAIENIPEKENKAVTEEPEAKPEIVASTEESMDLFSTAFDAEAKTVAEEISEKVNEESLAEKFQNDKINDLKEAIGINEKFFFINELFDGVMKEYNEAIETLNSKPSKEEATTYLNQLKEERGWKEDAEAFGQLKGILERKFD